jgi:NAD(P)-dependent dehydrogenase (short-subunit alcohol dehydrogenase family)
MKLSGRAAIVTGGGKGLGAAFVDAISSEGMAVLVNNRVRPGAEDSAEKVSEHVRSCGGVAAAERSDVADPAAPAAIVAAAVEHFGRLDALVLNAGVSGNARKVGELDSKDLRMVMETNFFAAVALVEAALPHLHRAGHGRILFISSTAGLHGIRGRSPYAASKGALTAFALSLAEEVRSAGIGVNILCPYAATAMTSREGEAIDPRLHPDNAAAMAAYLVSSDCTDTGEIFIAGGRRYRRARTVESPCFTAPDNSLEWISHNVELLKSMHGAREYRGADRAFRDFHLGLDAPTRGEENAP